MISPRQRAISVRRSPDTAPSGARNRKRSPSKSSLTLRLARCSSSWSVVTDLYVMAGAHFKINNSSQEFSADLNASIMRLS